MTENRCVSCGVIIPEGRQVCPACLAGIPPETYEELNETFNRIGLLVEEFIENLKSLFLSVNIFEELFEQLKGFEYIPKKPPPDTPYFFRVKTRTIFKRPKIYRIRSNCRKESY